MRTIRAMAAAAVLAGLLAAGGPASAKIMQLTLLSLIDGNFLDETDHLGVCGAFQGLFGGEGGSTGSRCGLNKFFLKTTFVYDTKTTPQFLSVNTDIMYEDVGFPTDFDGAGAVLGSVDFNPANTFINTVTPGSYEIDTYNQFEDPPYTDINGVYHMGVFTSALFMITFPSDGTSTLDENRLYHPTFADYVSPDYSSGYSVVQLLQFSYGPAPDDGATLYDVHFDSGIGDGQLITFSVNFKDITPNSVPEPASWALMLLGFGGLGAALRRRRVAGIAA